MASVGYTVFGRPVQHEYLSNGLFNEYNLNRESYLSDQIELKKGENLVILKRHKDNNGVEITYALLNTYAVSYNNRAGGFVGAGIAFTGLPSAKLIFHNLKYLHQQALNLLEKDSFKFKAPKIEDSSVILPDLSEDGLFLSRKPKKYIAKDGLIGVILSGNFYENLMSAIQGFCLNDSYSSIKTAFVTNNNELLKKIVGSKSIYQIHNLLDFSHVFNQHIRRLNEKEKKLKEDIRVNTNKLNDWKKSYEAKLERKKEDLKNFESQLNHRDRIISDREGVRKIIEDDIKAYDSHLRRLKFDERELENKRNDLRQEIIQAENKFQSIKHKNWQIIESSHEFQNFKNKYEQTINQSKQVSKARIQKLKKHKLLLILSNVILVFTAIFLTIILFKSLTEQKSLNDKIYSFQSNLKESSRILDQIPKEISSNEFLALDKSDKNLHKQRIKKAFNYIQNEKNDDIKIVFKELEKRTWNFREILGENDPKIDEGLKDLAFLKNMISKKQNELLYPPLFLIPDLKGKVLIQEEIDYKDDVSLEYYLKEYLKIGNNLYHKLGVHYEKPQKDDTYQNSDPTFLMHFRWMIYNFKDQKKDITNLKKGDNFLVPVLK